MRFDYSKTVLLPMTYHEAAILLKYMITFIPSQEDQNEIFNLTTKLRKLCNDTELD